MKKVVINEVGDLYKNSKFGSEGKYCVILMSKNELKRYKKSIDDFIDDDELKPKKYFLSQYYDGSCCFISKYDQQGKKIKPITFNSIGDTQKELDFMVKYTPKIMNKFIYKIIKYNPNEWK